MIKKIYDNLKQDFYFENNKIKYIIFNMLAIGGLVFLSIFWKWFSLLALALSIYCVIKDHSGKSLYYLIFLLPLMSIFKFNTSDNYLLIVLVAVVIVMLGIILLKDLIKKNKKINWPFTIMFCVVVVYFCLPFSFPSISITASLVLGCMLLFLAYYYWKDVDTKELVFVFALGTLFSVFIGLFNSVIPRLAEMTGLSYTMGYKRFCASSNNVNVFAGELMVLFSLFSFLFVCKKINFIYYPIYFLCSLLCILTMSKSALLIFGFINVYLFIAVIIKHRKEKAKSTLIISLLIICCCFAVLVVPARASTYWDRLIHPIIVGFNRAEENSQADDSEKVKTEIIVGNAFSEVTTGRTEIWKCYFNKIMESPKSLLFGHGVGAENVGVFGESQKMGSHNTFIQCTYYVGIVGILLLIVWLLTMFKFKRLKDINWYSIVVIISVGLFLCGADFFSYRLSNYLIMIFACICAYKESNNVEEKKKELGE